MRKLETELRRRNAARLSENKRRYLDRFPEKHAAREAKRRAELLQRTMLWADPDAIRRIYEEAARLSSETGVRHDVDHIIPLRGVRVSGLHVERNLRALPFRANRAKGNRFELECA